MNAPRSGPSLEQQVSEFVYRCGRVLAVPLATNAVALEWAHSMRLRGGAGGTQEVACFIPSEIELDALAARARPIFLKKDRCYYSQALTAMRRLVERSAHPFAEQYVAAVRDLKDGWSSVESARTTRYALMTKVSDQPRPGPPIPDSRLADSYLNGDLVHADEGRQQDGGRRERLLAGWAHHSEVCDLAKTTVAFGRFLLPEVGIVLNSWVFDTQDLTEGFSSLGEMSQLWMLNEDAPLDFEALSGSVDDFGLSPQEGAVAYSLPEGAEQKLTALPSAIPVSFTGK